MNLSVLLLALVALLVAPSSGIMCPERGTVPSGEVSCTDTVFAESVCSVTCNLGTQVIGTDVSECLPTGEWTAPLPVCQTAPCRDQGELKHGSITCTDGSNVESVCTFSCNDTDYELYPSKQSRNLCQAGQRWNLPKPCCTRPCLPYAVMDIVIVLDSSSSIGAENWVLLTSFVRGFVRSFIVSPTAANFAIFRFNRIVDTGTQIFLNSYPGDVDGLIEAFRLIPYDGRATFTGRALQHARRVSLSAKNGNRPAAKDIVFVITDGRAADEDDAKKHADALRASGATVLVLGIEPPRGSLDLGQLRDIAGSSDNLIIASKGFAELNTSFTLRLNHTFCGDPCE